MSKRKELKEVIEDFKRIHGDTYDYSLIKEYKNTGEKLPIICHNKNEKGEEHGVFFQSYGKHFTRKHGCPKCAKNGVQYNQIDFEDKINKIWGDKYTINGKYVNAHTPLKFICKEHGEFITKPYYLLQNHGCPLCGNLKISEKTKYSKEEILERFEEKHGNKYDYSKFEYSSYDESSIIICHKKDKNGKEHGIFFQSPHSHIGGHGCPKCSMSKLEEEISLFFDNNNIKYEMQKRFSWLKLQKLDFYLPEYNIAIECQGEQHYIPSNFGSKKRTPEEMFLYVCNRDKEKQKLCIENNVKILYYTKYEPAQNNKNTFIEKEKLLKEIIYDRIK